MATIAAVAAGGSLGTLARYGLDAAIERRSFSLFPWSTFAINMSGCFLVGMLIAALVDRHHAPHWLRIGLVVGPFRRSRKSRTGCWRKRRSASRS
jgi:fluoride exporter